MKFLRIRNALSLVLFALPACPTLVVGCASHDVVADSANTGEANVGVATQAVSTTDVTKVTLTVSGPGISTSIVKDLKYVNGLWTGKLSGIPVGTDRVFHADAYDATNTVLYSGEATAVTITNGVTASAAIVLQQKIAPDPFANGAPQIFSLVSSAAEVAPGESASLTVTATDPDNDPLSYVWTATGGTLANASTATPTWTAPLSDGTQTLSVSVTDGKGGQAGMSVQLKTNSKGSAGVSTTFNNWPVVIEVAASPGQLKPGESSNLNVAATDVDGDPLTYAWSDNCGGSFSSATTLVTPTWTAPVTAPPGGSCTLTVSVSDGRGGSTSGALVIGINLPDANLPPAIDQYYQSADAVSTAEQVNLWVSASDPEVSALAFSWTASGGTMGIASNTASSSEIMWTAPTAPGTYTVTATVVDTSGLTTVRAFEVVVSCQASLTQCGGTCVDTQTDLANCGACGVVCNGTCVAGTCASCNDGIKNGAETDVDCGGSLCPACGAGKQCALDSDCTTGPCNVCPSAVQLCLAPLGPVAFLQSGACKKFLDACTPPATATCGPVGTFPVGGYPSSMAFDGTNMWVVDNSSVGTVAKLSPSGVVLGTYTLGGGGLSGIAFDGTNMWVANIYPWRVFKLSPSGTVLGTYAVGPTPEGIAFDGTNMWVANSNYGGSGSVTQLSPSGVTLGTYPVGNGATGIAFDGTNMWVTNHVDGTVTKLSLSGATLGTYNVGSHPQFGIAFDGTNMWVVNSASDNVTKLSLSGATLGTYAVGTNPAQIAFDGTNMWVMNNGGDVSVTKLSPTGATLGTFPSNGYWIAFDGTHMWVTSGGSGTVTKL